MPPPRRRRRSSPSSQIRRTDDGRGFCHFSPFFSFHSSHQSCIGLRDGNFASVHHRPRRGGRRQQVSVCLLLQRTSKRRFQGFVKLGEKVAVCLPTAGRRAQFFHPTSSQPGNSLLEVPCTPFCPTSAQRKFSLRYSLLFFYRRFL